MNLIIIGASTRAAAFSAHRAGMRPWCVDLFADADLAQCFPVRKIPYADYPGGFLDALRDAPDGPVLFTGGLENYPDLLARIDRPLWGNPPAVLRQVRSPLVLMRVMQRMGQPVLEVRTEPPVPGDLREWLIKPLGGSGGVGIRHYRGQAFDARTHYLQEYRHGFAFGAVFLGIAGGYALPIGMTRLIHPAWLHAPAFHYCGNVMAPTQPVANLHAIGDALADAFGLRGLFGVDLVYDLGTADFRVLEVNPRYTASVEVLERALGVSALDLHRLALERRAVTWQPPENEPTTVVGKAILYARDRLVFPANGPWAEALAADPGAAIVADVPHAGQSIARGAPVMTVFAAANTEVDCLQSLYRIVAGLDPWLYPEYNH